MFKVFLVVSCAWDVTALCYAAAEGKIEHDGMHVSIVNMQGCSSAGVDLVSGDSFEKAQVVDVKGKAPEEVPHAEKNGKDFHALTCVNCFPTCII